MNAFPIKARDPIFVLLAVAHVLSLAAGVFLALGPVYQGVSVSPSNPYTASTTASLIAVNGLRVLPLLLLPVVVTAAMLLTSIRGREWSGVGKVLLWVSAVLLLLFCVAGVYSIGVFYVPSALLVIAAAIAASRRAR